MRSLLSKYNNSLSSIWQSSRKKRKKLKSKKKKRFRLGSRPRMHRCRSLTEKLSWARLKKVLSMEIIIILLSGYG